MTHPTTTWREDFKHWYYSNYMHFNITGSNRETYEDERFEQFESFIAEILGKELKGLLEEVGEEEDIDFTKDDVWRAYQHGKKEERQRTRTLISERMRKI